MRRSAILPFSQCTKGPNERVSIPGFLTFIVFAICESPHGYASAAFSAHNQGKEIWMSLLRTSHGVGSGSGEGVTQSPDKRRGARWGGFGQWGWSGGGRNGGRLQGSPAPRQMCLGVTPHRQRNESANRCLTSRPACHASYTQRETERESEGEDNACMHTENKKRGQAKELRSWCDFEQKRNNKKDQIFKSSAFVSLKSWKETHGCTASTCARAHPHTHRHTRTRINTPYTDV